ncbi:MAG TPA: hypothetical protein ENI66_01570 [Candidatus Yonathbacteria bacterium]|nr:hypothetical protein [Candidatus Yonathbacteria bacterium]
MRDTPFINREHYHIYNRGTDKRVVFQDEEDFRRFLQGIDEFNVADPIGSLYENFYKKKKNKLKNLQEDKLVNIIAYCLNPNHYHFILEQVADKGIEKFMQRLGNGYTKYFNNKNNRSGVLFQGRFKSRHVNTNEYLLHLSAYVNLNDQVHQLRHPMSKLVGSNIVKWSSWNEYTDRKKDANNNICNIKIITEQFNGRREYKMFASSSLKSIRNKRDAEKEFDELVIEG